MAGVGRFWVASATNPLGCVWVKAVAPKLNPPALVLPTLKNINHPASDAVSVVASPVPLTGSPTQVLFSPTQTFLDAGSKAHITVSPSETEGNMPAVISLPFL